MEILAYVRATSFHIDRVKRLACGHEEAVTLGAAEAYIGADFWKKDLPDTDAIGCEDMNTVIPFTNPTSAGPDISLGVAADAIGKSRDFFCR